MTLADDATTIFSIPSAQVNKHLNWWLWCLIYCGNQNQPANWYIFHCFVPPQYLRPKVGSILRFSWCDSYDFFWSNLLWLAGEIPCFASFFGNHIGNCSQKKTGSAHEAHPILQLVMFIRRMRTQCINGTTPGWSSYNHQVLSTTYSQISFKKSYMSWWNPWFQP